MGTWIRRWMALVVVALVAASCGGGSEEPLAAGEAAAEDEDQDADETSTTTTTEAPAEMPDVVGMTQTEAESELRALDLDEVTIDEAESLEESGTVLRQLPSAGARVRGSVTLVVAVPLPPMPDFVGSNLAEARDWYEDRDIDVVVEEVLDDSVPPGTVLATTPPAGAEVISEVLLKVSERPTTQALAEFEWPEEGRENCSTDVRDAEVNGELYPRSVVMSLGYYRVAYCSVDVNLSRDWSTFKATIGLDDSSASEAAVRFEVLADGNSIFRQTIGLGTEVPVVVDVTDVLRLRIIATSEVPVTAEAVWGEAVVQGLPPE